MSKDEKDEKNEEKIKYSGLLLIDILNPDWKNFFKKYAIDVIGFTAISIVVFLIIWGTSILI